MPACGWNWKIPTELSCSSVEGVPISHFSVLSSLFVSSTSMGYGIFTALFRSTILLPKSIRELDTTSRGRRPSATTTRCSGGQLSTGAPASIIGNSKACLCTRTGRYTSCKHRDVSALTLSL